MMHVLSECAIRWEFIEQNPITLVRQGGARRAEPEVLQSREFRALLAELTGTVPNDGHSGRMSGPGPFEFTGLKWADFDWDAATLSVQRGVVQCHVGDPKTLARRNQYRSLPNCSGFYVSGVSGGVPADSDWVFASPYKHGRDPYWPDSALKDFVKPAASGRNAKRVGWHTFRHTYLAC